VVEDGDWTPMRLIHEIVADLESLQGASVEWGKKSPFTTNEYLVRILTGDGKVFDVDVSITECI
jgi:hypothetical protein